MKIRTGLLILLLCVENNLFGDVTSCLQASFAKIVRVLKSTFTRKKADIGEYDLVKAEGMSAQVWISITMPVRIEMVQHYRRRNMFIYILRADINGEGEVRGSILEMRVGNRVWKVLRDGWKLYLDGKIINAEDMVSLAVLQDPNNTLELRYPEVSAQQLARTSFIF